MLVVVALLQSPRLVRLQLQQFGDEGAHVLVDLREQIDVMRVERVVEVEDPLFDMGEIGGRRGGAGLGHAALCTLLRRKKTADFDLRRK